MRGQKGFLNGYSPTDDFKLGGDVLRSYKYDLPLSKQLELSDLLLTNLARLKHAITRASQLYTIAIEVHNDSVTTRTLSCAIGISRSEYRSMNRSMCRHRARSEISTNHKTMSHSIANGDQDGSQDSQTLHVLLPFLSEPFLEPGVPCIGLGLIKLTCFSSLVLVSLRRADILLLTGFWEG